MYARHSAWLNATPEKSEKPRRELYTEDSPYVTPVELNEYEAHLVGLWHEAGTVSQSGMGLAPLEWGQIIIWADRFYSDEEVEWVKSPSNRWMPILSHVRTLTDGELQIIRQLSQEYCSEYSQASDPQRECPKIVFVDEVDGKSESARFGEAFKMMFGKKADEPKYTVEPRK